MLSFDSLFAVAFTVWGGPCLISGGSRGGSLPDPIFQYPMVNEIIWSHRDQTISFSWDI